MTEFLFSLHYLAEVSAFARAGQKLNNGYTSPDSSAVASMTTATAYCDQQLQAVAIFAKATTAAASKA